MPLAWKAPYPQQPPCWFRPDRMENIRHDAPDDVDILVVTVSGAPVCGRIVEGAVQQRVFVLDRNWEWR